MDEKTLTVSIRFREVEHRRLIAAAERVTERVGYRISVAEYVRSNILRQARADLELDE